MALKNVDATGGGSTTSASKMAVGEKLTGYVLGFVDGQYGPNINMQKEDGNRFTLFTAKNLQYKINDGKIKIGVYTEITRLADKLVGGKKASQFTVEQDAERTIAMPTELDEAGVTSDVSDISTAKPKSTVAARAAALANQVK